MAAMKKNAEMTPYCFQGQFFTTILQIPTLSIQTLVIAIFKNPLTFDKRYGPSHPKIASIQFTNIFNRFLVDLHLPSLGTKPILPSLD